MYESYWGLREKPFSNTPDPRYLYLSPAHEEAMTRLLYAVTETRGGVLLTGDYGCGKTLLTRVLLAELDPSRFEVALITHPNLSPDEILRELMYQFGAPWSAGGKSALLRSFASFLLACDARGRGVVVVVDEAQLVTSRLSLEELRLLLNLQKDDRFLLTLVLSGQPELRGVVDSVPQFKQRLTLRCHIGPLDEKESAQYILHRLRMAGARRPVFSRDALAAVHTASTGVPRVINSLCDFALLVGFGRRAKCVDDEIVWQVAGEVAA